MTNLETAYRAIELIEGTDVYLLDQIMKQRFSPGCAILDAGCGGGRNVGWFLRAGFQVHGVDVAAGPVQALRATASELAPGLSPHNFSTEPVEKLSFADATFDAVLSIAVLHFARDHSHFDAMLGEMWRVLKPGGVLFARLASASGIEGRVQDLGKGRYRLPDGTIRYLVDTPRLGELTARLDGQLLEPIKTVNVHDQRCMATWVVEKTPSL